MSKNAILINRMVTNYSKIIRTNAIYIKNVSIYEI